ncbi:MAG: hypothetical protein JW730_08325 [Anaerolineales bacterium]|nr:hypothetical protein [Anaerolineales bacterium]
MKSNFFRSLTLVFAIILIAVPACNLASEAATPVPATQEEAPLIPVAGPPATATLPPTPVPATSTAAVIHTMTPTEPRAGKLLYDVESAGTAPEKRAPYGDSYEWNRLERPFTQDMGYVSGLDIDTFTVSKDDDWWYVSINIVSIDPGSTPEINYGVELDLDHDGFGDYLLWAHPPYSDQWDTAPVQIYQDQNHNTAGLSAGKSDAPFTTDGYETLIFDGAAGGDDPDLAWIRVATGSPATVQFAFKKSWSGDVFMLGVIADAGLKDPKKLDYVDRFQIADAGSPVKENKNYPLKELFLVDNTCRGAFGFNPSGFEPQLCPVPVPPSKTPAPNPGASCPDPGPNVCAVWDSVQCVCLRR